MTKQEQIKEMGQILCERSKDGICMVDKTLCDSICGWAMQAEEIYNAGYRKTFTSDLASDTQKAFKEGYEKACNETAREILILLGKGFDETKMTEFKNLPWYKLFYRELKQKYGVEVEDETL